MAKGNVVWLVAIISIFFVLLYRLNPPAAITNTVVEVDTLYIETTIIDTVYVKGNQVYVDHVVVDTLTNTVYVYREVESDTHSLFETKDYSDSLYIRYTSVDDNFTINRNINIYNKHIYEKVTETRTAPPKMISLSANIGVWSNKDEYPMSIGAGVKIYDKYTIMGSIKTDKEIGLSLGVDF